jgi:excinuclease ABC subunit B
MQFQLKTSFRPTGDQPQAIKTLVTNLKQGQPHQVLLGTTGSGKTFTLANVIAALNRPTLVISHNKTLAAQTYQEFRDFFPDNAVSYFVSYYDYYQPEAYIPQIDTYIAKETDINAEIDKLRLAATTNLLTRKDVIVVASVSCIYNLGSPVEYGKYTLAINPGQVISRPSILSRLLDLQYDHSTTDLYRGSFRLQGEILQVWPAYEDHALKIQFLDNTIESIDYIDPVSKQKIENCKLKIENYVIYPAKHYLTDPLTRQSALAQIRADLNQQLKFLRSQGQDLEAHRLQQRVNYDLEMIREVGSVNGIENYSRYFDGRAPGQPPFTLLDYFPANYLTIIDESHITVPQIRGMYRGDRSRKQTLVDYGFRLPSALDNRPLQFTEFLARAPQIIYTSATPNDWEINLAKSAPVEQLIRPTGLVDPPVTVRPISNQITDLITAINATVAAGQRVLVTTLTKRMAEALTDHLKQQQIKVHYLHSDIDTLDRSDILDSLRAGDYDVVVGINLLREGLDLPEVALVAILDADKEGFLRSKTALIQTMGRAARHVNGRVIMYADTNTASMRAAIAEVSRRRRIQLAYNRRRQITPQSVTKPIRAKLIKRQKTQTDTPVWKNLDLDSLIPSDKKTLIRRLSRQMALAARDLNFEIATRLRDTIEKLKN